MHCTLPGLLLGSPGRLLSCSWSLLGFPWGLLGFSWGLLGFSPARQSPRGAEQCIDLVP